MSPAMTIRSGFCSSMSSTARRNASAMSASRWFVPLGVCRSNWRNPRWRSARWASLSIMSVRLVGDGVQRRHRMMFARHACLGVHTGAEHLAEIGEHIVGTGAPHNGERPTHVVRLAVRNQILDLVRPDAPVQTQELTHDGIVE